MDLYPASYVYLAAATISFLLMFRSFSLTPLSIVLALLVAAAVTMLIQYLFRHGYEILGWIIAVSPLIFYALAAIGLYRYGVRLA